MTDAKPDVLGTDERPLYCDLTPDELRERGDQLAVLMGEIDHEREEIKETVKELKQALAEKTLRAAKLAGTIRMRREERAVTIETRAITGGVAQEIRTDTGEVIRTRPMTEAERQRMLPRIGPEAEAAAGA